MKVVQNPRFFSRLLPNLCVTFLLWAITITFLGNFVAHSEEEVQPTETEEATTSTPIDDEEIQGPEESEESLWADEKDFSKKEFNYYGALMFGYSFDKESSLNKAEGEWATSFSYGSVTGRLRIGDFVNFPNERKPVRIEKYQVTIPTGNFEFSLGTFPLTFGKGLILNAFEERNLNYDNEIEGILFKAKAGDLKLINFIGKQKPLKETSASRFIGSRAEWQITPKVQVGASWISEDEPNTATFIKKSRKKTVSYGTDLQFSLEHFNLYLEHMRMDQPFGAPDGNGLYASATLKYPGFGLTIERKDYDQILHRLGVPPPTKYTPEHAFSTPSDEKGYAISMFLAPFENTSYFEVTYDQSNQHGGGFPQTETIISYYAPRDRNFFYSIHKSRYKDVSIEDEFWRVESQYTFNNGNALSLNCEITDYSVGPITRKEQKVELGFTFGTWLNVSFTQEKLPRRNNPKRQWWNLLEARLQRSGKDVLSLTYGTRRAGFVCSGGVCRLEPAFDGWKLFYTRYF